MKNAYVIGHITVPEYQSLIPLREEAAEIELLSYEEEQPKK